MLYPYGQFRLLFGGDPREVPDVTQVTVNGHCPGRHGLHYLKLSHILDLKVEITVPEKRYIDVRFQ